MDAKNNDDNTRCKVVHRTIYGCPVSIRAEVPKTPAADLTVLRYLTAAYEERLKHEKAR